MKKIIAISAILLSGCTTIHFDRSNTLQLDAVEKEQWHHNIVFSVIEASDPVDLKEVCGEQEWTSVKTEFTFLNWGSAFLLDTVTKSPIPLWTPKTVTTSCI
jgi:hypothetical protein